MTSHIDHFHLNEDTKVHEYDYGFSSIKTLPQKRRYPFCTRGSALIQLEKTAKFNKLLRPSSTYFLILPKSPRNILFEG
jgi:hypothetical protein